jgi:molybdenum-dependent DNA-binding transcriptional regulator ModE
MPAPTYRIDEALFEFGTPRQVEYMKAVNTHRSIRAAARSLNIGQSAVTRAIRSVRRKAALMGYAPGHFNSGVAVGFRMGKVTVQRAADGSVERTWERQSPEAQQLEALREFAETLSEGVKGLVPISKAPKHAAPDLLSVYPWGDPHFGMYAWWQDAGADFDLSIAEKLTTSAVDRLVSVAPEGSVGMLLNLGDMFHADNQKNTTQSGHQLDVDGRWAKVQQVGLKAMIHCIRRMLEKHSKVIVRINKGNHDGHSSYALSLMLSCYFCNDPRVEVDLSPATCFYYEFGSVLIGSTHGDEIKGKDMGAVMAADKPKAWGRTTHRYWYVGHVHHKDVKEYPGVIVEYVRTLAARDAWHQGQGYRAGRDMQLVVLHKEHGEVERYRCDVGMLVG